MRRALVLVGKAHRQSSRRRTLAAARFRSPRKRSCLRTHRRLQAEERLALADVYVGREWYSHARTVPRFTQTGSSRLPPDRAGREPAPARPHDLRHGWATRALEAGVPTKVVQEVLGHASAMITLDVYSHVVPAMKSNAAQLVADLVTPKR